MRIPNFLPKIPLKSEDVYIIETPGDYRIELLSRIRNVKNRIYICSLYMGNDEAGQEILNALSEAKHNNPNLDIKVFVDFHRNQRNPIGDRDEKNVSDRYYAINLNKPEAEKIDIFGVPVEVSERNGVLHTKGIVIDDTLFYSGASLNNVYLCKKGQYRLDRYWKISSAVLADMFVIYMRGAFLNNDSARRLDQGRVLVDKLLKDQIRSSRRRLREIQFVSDSQPDFDLDNDMYAVPVAGFGKANVLTDIIVDLIKSAEENIVIYTPYFNLSDDVRKAIHEALKRRVKIDLLVGDMIANDFYRSPDEVKKYQRQNKLTLKERMQLFLLDCIPYYYEQNLKDIAKRFNGQIKQGMLNLYLWKHGDNTYHAKGISVDNGRHILITGHNINERADVLDLENGILIRNVTEELKRMAAEELKRVKEHASLISSYKVLPNFHTYPLRSKTAVRLVSLMERCTRLSG